MNFNYLFYNPFGAATQWSEGAFISKIETVEANKAACARFFLNMFGEDMGTFCKFTL